MIKIEIDERCEQCGGRLRRELVITDEDKHSTMPAFEAGQLTAIWHHHGWVYDNCICLVCPDCQTLHTLDIGAIEMHCHPDVSVGHLDLDVQAAKG